MLVRHAHERRQERAGGVGGDGGGISVHDVLRGFVAQVHDRGERRTLRRCPDERDRRAVAVVANAIDDQLPKGGQLLPRWTIDAVRDHFARLVSNDLLR